MFLPCQSHTLRCPAGAAAQPKPLVLMNTPNLTALLLEKTSAAQDAAALNALLAASEPDVVNRLSVVCPLDDGALLEALEGAREDARQQRDILDTLQLEAVLDEVLDAAVQGNKHWETATAQTVRQAIDKAAPLHASARALRQKVGTAHAVTHLYHWETHFTLARMDEVERTLRHDSETLRDSMLLLKEALGRAHEAPAQVTRALHLCLRVADRLNSLAQDLDIDIERLEMTSEGALELLQEAVQHANEAEARSRQAPVQTDSHAQGPSMSSGAHSPLAVADDYEPQPWQPEWNPSTGLPMVQGSFVDVSGHTYGTGEPGGLW